MDLRDQFAMEAFKIFVQAVIDDKIRRPKDGSRLDASIAKDSYDFADAMVQRRNVTKRVDAPARIDGSFTELAERESKR